MRTWLPPHRARQSQSCSATAGSTSSSGTAVRPSGRRRERLRNGHAGTAASLPGAATIWGAASRSAHGARARCSAARVRLRRLRHVAPVRFTGRSSTTSAPLLGVAAAAQNLDACVEAAGSDMISSEISGGAAARAVGLGLAGLLASLAPVALVVGAATIPLPLVLGLVLLASWTGDEHELRASGLSTAVRWAARAHTSRTFVMIGTRTDGEEAPRRCPRPRRLRGVPRSRRKLLAEGGGSPLLLIEDGGHE